MSRTRGFTLVETIVAVALVAGAAVTLAQLLAIGAHTTAVARYRTLASVLAQRKVEQLRGEATLADVASAVEHVDGSGKPVCLTNAPCAAAVFTVRWSIAPHPVVEQSVVIQVTAGHAHTEQGTVRAFAIAPRTVR